MSSRKRVTIKDVAEAAGVSRTAVSFVLNGREKGLAESTRKRIVAAATRLGYVRPSSILNRRAWTRVALLVQPSGGIAHTSFYANVQQHLVAKEVLGGLEGLQGGVADKAIFGPGPLIDGAADLPVDALA